MSITEQTIAKLRTNESYSGVTRPATFFAIFSLLTGGISPSIIYPNERPYKAIEVSGSSFTLYKIIDQTEIKSRIYRPKTALGERLMALRNKAISKGLKLLNAEEIADEVRLRRGETI